MSFLLKLLFAYFLLEVSLGTLEVCQDRRCLEDIHQKSKNGLKINWKPNSVFPDEAKRFQ